MARIVIAVVGVGVLWPLSTVYRLFGPLGFLALSGVSAVAVFAWTKRDARR